MNPRVSLITGVVCGVRIEEIKEPLMKKIRYLDKLVDELAKGKAMDAILRSETKGSAVSLDVDKFVKNSKQWKTEIEALRKIVLEAKLEEHLKWGKPTYAQNEANIVIIQPFKTFLALMFFKGMLLKDPKKILVNNGPNSQSAKRLEFNSVETINKMKSTIKAYIKEAIALEEAGTKVEFKKQPQETPEELARTFAKMPKLKKAFESLTPGRQRAYLLHFSGAKQAATRQSRIDKVIPQILAGKGLADRR